MEMIICIQVKQSLTNQIKVYNQKKYVPRNHKFDALKNFGSISEKQQIKRQERFGFFNIATLKYFIEELLMSMHKKNVLCIGGAGFLGSRIISSLASENCLNVDFFLNSQAKTNIIMKKDDGISSNNLEVVQKLQKQKIEFDSIIVASGAASQVGSIQDLNYQERYQKFIDAYLMPCMLAYKIKKLGLLKASSNNQKTSIVFLGAADVFREPQSERFFYSMVKMQVHSLAMSIAAQNNKNMDLCSMVTVLPEIINSPENRKNFPSQFTKNWLDPYKVVQVVSRWIKTPKQMPINGSFVHFRSQRGKLVYSLV